MATSGSKRKNRAWRKPREELGPGTVELSGHQGPRKLDRVAVHRDAMDTVNERGIPISPAVRPAKRNGDAVDQSESLQQDTPRGCGTESMTGRPAAQGVGNVSCTASREAAATDTNRADPPLLIDGSVLEGDRRFAYDVIPSIVSYVICKLSAEEHDMVVCMCVCCGQGGQILRIAMALSCLLSRAVTITRIRAGRGNPGLRPQHLTGIELLSRLCGGTLVGAAVGSTEITFTPRPVRGGEFEADTKTAGSVCLILQAALPCLLFSSLSSKITLRGGTDADMAPPIDFTVKVFQPIAAMFGVHFDCKLVRRGFFPKGRGEMIITTPTGPVKRLNAITMTDPGTPVTIRIHSYVAGAVSIKMSKQMVFAACKVLEKQLPGVTIDVVEVQETQSSAFGNSSGIIAIAESSTGCLFAGSANGRKSEGHVSIKVHSVVWLLGDPPRAQGDPAEKTGKTAAEQLVQNIRGGGCVDEHLQDQLIIFMALAEGTSSLRTGPLTLHTQTAIHIAELMTRARFKVQKVGGATGEVNLIECEGIGLENKFN